VNLTAEALQNAAKEMNNLTEQIEKYNDTPVTTKHVGSVSSGGVSVGGGLSQGAWDVIQRFNEKIDKYRKIFGFQHGGIVTKPTPGIVGEAGPEAVIPLDKAGSLGNTTYNVTINIDAQNMDVDELKNRIGEEFVREIEMRMRR
jgi:hypothetical protein